ARSVDGWWFFRGRAADGAGQPIAVAVRTDRSASTDPPHRGVPAATTRAEGDQHARQTTRHARRKVIPDPGPARRRAARGDGPRWGHGGGGQRRARRRG